MTICSLDETALVACRVPYLPFETVRTVFDAQDTLASLKALWIDRADVRAAVLLSSPPLHAAACDWADGKPFKNKSAPLKLLMYLLRMSARCTPFGTFAGIGIVPLGESTTLRMEHSPFSTVTKADTGWLATFVEAAEQDLAASGDLPLYANDLVVEHGERLYVLDPRRVEPNDAGLLDFVRISVRKTEGVSFVRDIAAEPIALRDLIRQVDERFGAGVERAAAFVETLRAASILLSALRPSPVDAPIDMVGEQLAHAKHPLHAVLIALKERCAALDGVPVSERNDALYQELAARFTGVAAYDRFPLHIDMRCSFEGTLGTDVLSDVATLAAYSLRANTPRATLAKFRERFVAMYEGTTQLVPLLDLCDAGFGLGPPERAEQPFLDKARAGLMSELAAGAINSGATEVEVDDDLLDRLLPAPRDVRGGNDFELGFEVAAASLDALREGQYLIALGNLPGSNAAAKTLGRFAHLFSPDITARIASAIVAPRPDSVEAELIFPPAKESFANLATRPRFLRHEIQLGVRLAGENTVRLDPGKLRVGLRDGRFYLWSTQIDAEIRIRESHVFHTYGNAPSLVMFLSALSGQDAAAPGVLNWNEASWLPFVPRLRKGRIVLLPAQWRIDLDALRAADDRAKWLDDFRRTWRVPQYVFVQEMDNRLPLKLDHPMAADLLLAASGHAKRAMLVESLHDPKATWLESATGDGHIAEFVANVSVRRDNDVPRRAAPVSVGAVRAHTPRTGWTYLRVPCGTNEQDRIIRLFAQEAERLQRESVTAVWFFVRYADVRPHLRLRFKACEGGKEAQDDAVTALGERLVDDGTISEYSIHTYLPEYERYGGEGGMSIAERLFSVDSSIAAAHLERLDDDDERLYRAVKTAYPLINAFLSGLSADDLDRCLAAERSSLHPRLRERVKAARAELAAEPPEGAAAFLPVAEELIALEREARLGVALTDVVSAFLHMHFNRFGIDAMEGRGRQMLRALHQSVISTSRAQHALEVV